MHIALVVDPERLLSDAAPVQRLAVALAGEGIRVLRILPPSRDEAPLSQLIPVASFDFDSSILFRPSRLGALSSSLEDAKPDVFVSFGPRAFDAAAELADDLDAGLVAMISTEDELDVTPLKRHNDRIDVVCVPTAPIAVRAGRLVGDRHVSVLPLGVQLPVDRRAATASPQSLAIAGTGRDEGAYRAVFAAIADVMPALPDLQVAIELPPGHDPKLWRLAREMGIQPVLNGVSRLESVRPLALACGVMVLPEAIHGVRSIVLEAMALGRTLVAMDDPYADHLIDGVTAMVAKERDAREWTALLTKALLQPAAAAGVGEEAAVRTAARFGSARCADQLAEACESVVRGPSIPFPGAGTASG